MTHKHSRKRILFVHANNMDVGGADYCLFRLVKELRESSVAPVVLLRKKTRIMELYHRERIRVILFPLVRLQRTYNPVKLLLMLLWYPVSVLAIICIALWQRVEIIHSNDLLDLAGSLAAKLSGRKAVQHIRMIVFKRQSIRNFVARLLLLCNDTVLCVSSGVAAWYFGVDHQHLGSVQVLYDWMDVKAVGHDAQTGNIRANLLLPSGVALVAMVGRLEPWKGHHVFLRAAVKVAQAKSDVHFLVIGGVVLGRGRERYAEELQNIVQRGGIQSRVHFLGERRDVYSLMRECDLLVHASVEPDPFPGVVLEGLYSGTPVVAARAGGVPEQIQEGETGLLHSPGDDKDLAEKILRLLSDKAEAGRFGTNAVRDVERRFLKETILPQAISHYDRLVS